MNVRAGLGVDHINTLVSSRWLMYACLLPIKAFCTAHCAICHCSDICLSDVYSNSAILQLIAIGLTAQMERKVTPSQATNIHGRIPIEKSCLQSFHTVAKG